MINAFQCRGVARANERGGETRKRVQKCRRLVPWPGLSVCTHRRVSQPQQTYLAGVLNHISLADGLELLCPVAFPGDSLLVHRVARARERERIIEIAVRNKTARVQDLAVSRPERVAIADLTFISVDRASKLRVRPALHISPMVLVEILDLIINIDRARHSLIHVEVQRALR